MAKQVLILQLSKDGEADAYHGGLCDTLRSKITSKFTTIEENSVNTAIELLAKPSKPQAVFVVDAGIARGPGKKIQKPLAEYARAGGTVVFGFMMSAFVGLAELNTLFGVAFSLQWKYGDYHRSTFVVNQALKPVFGGELFATMKKSYSMKAVHLSNVGIESRLYVPTASLRVESNVFDAPVDGTPVDGTQSPIVFAKYGEGYVGFIGDVNNEEATGNVTMAMLQKAMKEGKAL